MEGKGRWRKTVSRLANSLLERRGKDGGWGYAAGFRPGSDVPYTALVGNQVKSGCARGSWDPKGTYERQTGGRVMATALGALMLTQPYRHRRMR